MLKGPNFGSELALTAAQILATYVAGSTLLTGAFARVRFYYTLTGKAGTAISPVKLKVQACRTDPDTQANWYDIASSNDAGEAGDNPVVEHSIAVASDTTVHGSLWCDGSLAFLRIAVVGAAQGSGADAITVYAHAAGIQ